MKSRIISIFKCFIYFIGIITIQMLVNFACILPVIIKNHGLDASSKNALISEASIHSILFANAAAYILFVAIIYFIIRFRKRKLSDQIRLHKVPIKAYCYPVLTAFSFSMFWNILIEKLIRLPEDIKYSLDNYNAILIESKNYFSTLLPAGGTIMFVMSIIMV